MYGKGAGFSDYGWHQTASLYRSLKVESIHEIRIHNLYGRVTLTTVIGDRQPLLDNGAQIHHAAELGRNVLFSSHYLESPISSQG